MKHTLKKVGAALLAAVLTVVVAIAIVVIGSVMWIDARIDAKENDITHPYITKKENEP